MDPDGLLTIHPSLLSMLRASERACLTKQGGKRLQNGTQGCLLAYVYTWACVYVHTYIPTQCTCLNTYKHAHIHNAESSVDTSYKFISIILQFVSHDPLFDDRLQEQM